MAWRAWLPEKALSPWASFLLGGALAGAGAAARLLLGAQLAHTTPFITFYPVLVLAAAVGGAIGGASCLAFSVAAVFATFGVPHGAEAWAFVIFLIGGVLIILVASALSDSVRQLRRAQKVQAETEARLQTLVGELAHRNRNALFVIMAIVSQSARGAGSAAEAAEIINGRLQALLRAQDALLQADGAMASLRGVLERVLEPFDQQRFQIESTADFPLENDVAAGLGLLFHELATNAVKYGALSRPSGKVVVRWRIEADAARLTWREVGGPPVEPPTRKGFGARLVEAALVPQGGKAERRFEPDGLVCELQIPRPSGSAQPLPGARFAAQGPDGGARTVAGDPA